MKAAEQELFFEDLPPMPTRFYNERGAFRDKKGLRFDLIGDPGKPCRGDIFLDLLFERDLPNFRRMVAAYAAINPARVNQLDRLFMLLEP